MDQSLDALAPDQRELLRRWLPELEVVADLSWGIVETTVLEARTPSGAVIVKAGGATDHHIAREIRAHRDWVGVWAAESRAPQLLHADADARLLVTRHLPGSLVEGSPAAQDPGTYRQAGRLLARFHAQHRERDETWWDRERGRVLALLDRPHRIDGATLGRLREDVVRWPGGSEVLVPAHGDYQARNWLDDHGILRVIDFGRSALRPPLEDLARLASDGFSRAPLLEESFCAGYGTDPGLRTEPMRRHLVAQAIATAVWAFDVGDADFEAHGHRLIDGILA